ncbi:hypothetical protein [Sulfuricella sp.]|uniref:hypothetical protein n=1 Tax=Sulfuricella sp. TaxID=2099377 RepID=UPI002C7F04FC|nr:hypothetical protein [Sulfuricella sp.]HUX63187.1 hypothetical protein [Sulfuricella sp.]
MNHPTEPPQLVKMMIGITVVMVILLTGVTLGVLADADTIIPISGSASGEPSASQVQEKDYTRPVLHLDSTDRLETNRGATKSCSQASPAPGGQPDADAKQCSPQPLRIDKQKLLVLLALWRFKS